MSTKSFRQLVPDYTKIWQRMQPKVHLLTSVPDLLSFNRRIFPLTPPESHQVTLRCIVLRLLELVACEARLSKSRGYFKHDKGVGGMACSPCLFYFLLIPPIILSCNLG